MPEQPSVHCPFVLEPWHDDKYSDYYRECCDHAPVGPIAKKALQRPQPATVKASA